MFASGFAWQQVSWTEPSSQAPLKVALVQGNIPQQLKWSPSYRDQIIEHYLSLSAPLLEADSAVDLIVWPETALPLLYHQAWPALAGFEQRLRDSKSGLISGIPYRAPATQDEPARYHNSIMALGQADGLYHKQRLVPFGEYVPLENWLRGLIDFFDLPMSNFSLGPDQQQPIQLNSGGQETRISASICYEIVYPDLIASSAADAHLLLTISNDSWFGDSLAPTQHLQMARMRALETGRPLIRATNNGISALVGADGQIQQQGPQFQVDLLLGSVQPFSGTTPFVLWGSTAIGLIALVLLIGCSRYQPPSQKN